MFEQILRVQTDQIDGDEFGNEWRVGYVLYRAEDDDGAPCFDLYEDDGRGNGAMICRGQSERRMLSLTLKLGEFVEWKAAA